MQDRKLCMCAVFTSKKIRDEAIMPRHVLESGIMLAF